jgi:hypothetical protein
MKTSDDILNSDLCPDATYNPTAKTVMSSMQAISRGRLDPYCTSSPICPDSISVEAVADLSEKLHDAGVLRADISSSAAPLAPAA